MLIEMQKNRSNDQIVRLRIVDQRNCMQSGTNYTTHPQHEDLAWRFMTQLSSKFNDLNSEIWLW